MPNHSAQYVWQHSAVYSGLDTRAVGIKPEEALEDLRHFYFGSPTLLEPSYVVLSGNGLWLIWLIQPVTMQHRWLWQLVQEYVHRVLSLFNPDKHDPSKFIRAAGSANSSNGYGVRLLTVTRNRYTLEELGAYLPEERLIPPKRRRFKPKHTGQSRPKTTGSRKGLL